MSRFAAFLMPETVTRYTRVMAWFNLVMNIVIVGTGGLVRLTGSGLGCPTWPLCTDESLVPTSAMGIHGLIEFSNRTLTGVLIVVALLSFLSVMRTPKKYGLRGPTILIGVLIIVQAVIGGFTVWLHLDPRIVGVHFFFSVALVAAAAVSLQRVRLNEPLPTGTQTPNRVWVSLVVVTALAWLTEFVGVLTTGAGPHAGDSIAARNGLDPVVMQHVHAWPSYALLCAILVSLVLVFRASELPSTRRNLVVLTALVLVQIVVGVYQARTGLPIASVAVHMVIAVVVIATSSMLLVNARRTK